MSATSDFDRLVGLIVPSRTLKEDYSHLKLVHSKIIETRRSIPQLDRAVALVDFQRWLAANNINTDQLDIKYSEQGFGVYAAKNVEQGEELVNVDRQMMITSVSDDDLLTDMIQSDQILRSFKALILIIRLLKESYNKTSLWKEYIQILPTIFSIPMFFSPQEFESLKGLSIMHSCVKDLFNSLRQYCHLYKLLQKFPVLPIDYFTYSRFEWARAVTMTRQNEIQIWDNGLIEPHLSLIPLYDMFNHASGILTSHFDVGSQRASMTSHKGFEVGREITMTYGKRSNQDLFLHSGFVDSNLIIYDSLRIWLEIPVNADFDKRKSILFMNGLESFLNLT